VKTGAVSKAMKWLLGCPLFLFAHKETAMQALFIEVWADQLQKKVT
jgi:hypothetical protein